MTPNLPKSYSTKIFTEIYNNEADFLRDWHESGLNRAQIRDDSVNYLFYLLYARYGNSPIANMDVTQFKYKMWSIIATEGPNWEKRCDIQEKLRKLQDEDILVTETYESVVDRVAEGTTEATTNGSNKTSKDNSLLSNHAFNPNSAPVADTEQPLSYINDQTYTHDKGGSLDETEGESTGRSNSTSNDVLKSKRNNGRVKAYLELWDLLKDDVTTAFVSRFKICFKQFIIPEVPTMYITPEDDDDWMGGVEYGY